MNLARYKVMEGISYQKGYMGYIGYSYHNCEEFEMEDLATAFLPLQCLLHFCCQSLRL